MRKKVVITAAITGAGTKKASNPNLPVTKEEIVRDAIACAKAGASVIHFHMRDKDTNNCMDTDVWIDTITAVREAMARENVDLVINCTSSGSKFPEDLRLAHLPILKPEMTSFDAGTMNWNNDYVFMNRPQFLERLGTLTQEYGIKPEIEIFDGGMLGNVEHYLKEGFLREPLHYQLILNVGGGMPGNIESVNYLASKLRPDCTWSISGIGKTHLPCLLAGLAAGADGIRVGLEDNIYFERGVLATNVQLVERAVKIAELAGRDIATPQDAREILGLRKN